MKFNRVCCVCHVSLSEQSIDPALPTSHGYCDKCLKIELANIKGYTTYRGFYITRLASDKWKLEVEYQYGTVSDTFKSFHEALMIGNEYVRDDEAHARGESEDTLLEILREIPEEK
ncbi:MAG: hypothetical protein ACRCZI_06675 [Cetobacterium sp.]